MSLRIPGAQRPRLRLAIIAVFVALAGLFYLWLHVQMGGDLPYVTGGYEVRAAFDDADNLVEDGDLRMAGVPVGNVQSLEREDGRAIATLRIDEAYEPLHEGATVQLRPKSLVGETFIDIVDGDGEPIAERTLLPKDATLPSVSLDDVLSSLDGPTRQAISSTLQSLGTATDETTSSVDELLEGLGDLGGDGATMVALLADQSEDLQTLVAQTSRMLEALDQGEGQIADLVGQASDLFETTSARAEQLEAVTSRLPSFLDETRDGLSQVEDLTVALEPVADDLREAAPQLDRALVELRPTVRDLRGALPELDSVLVSAPPTLDRLPGLSRDIARLTPDLKTLMGDLNPMLGYVEPYSRDLGTFFTGFLGLVKYDEQGAYARILPIMTETAFRGYPIPAEQLTTFDRSNPYPDPESLDEPGEPFTGEYPRVEEEPVEDE